SSVLFLHHATPTTEIYTLSLHDALPISDLSFAHRDGTARRTLRALSLRQSGRTEGRHAQFRCLRHLRQLQSLHRPRHRGRRARRSEEHTSELQSRENLVCRLLLEKKKYQ